MMENTRLAPSVPTQDRGGFQSLYLVDTGFINDEGRTLLAPGLITRVPLNANAIFTGNNGVGKTSRMLLIALFLGAEPSEVAAPGKRFEDLYLPRSTSFLCMDYRNGLGQKRCVVVYMVGHRLCYRLVDDWFSRDWVSKDGDFIETKELSSRLIDLGVAFHPQQIETIREYRQIIQGTQDENSRHARALKASYSLAGPRYKLPNIDKIILGMLRKMVDLRSLQSIIADCVCSDDIAMGGNASMLVNQLRDIDAVTRSGLALERTQAVIPKIEMAETAYKEHQAAITMLRRSKFRTEQSLPHMEAAIADVASGLAEKEQRRDEKVQNHGQTIGVMRGRIAATKQELAKERGNLDALEAKKLEWDAIDPAQMVSRAKSESSFRRQLNDERDRRRAFDAESSEISSRFSEQRQALESRHTQILRDLDESTQREQQDLRAQKERLTETQAREKTDLEVGFRNDRVPLQEAAQQSATELAVAKAERPGAAIEEELAAIGLVRVRLDKHRDRWEEATRSHRAIEVEFERIKSDASSLMAAKRARETEIDRLEEDIRGINEDLAEASRSLRGFLRSEVPGWERGIGKVIDPVLLKRSDLSPLLDPGSQSESVFGLKLDLTGVDAIPDDDGLRAQLAVFRESLQALKQAKEQLEADLKASGVKLEACGKRLSESEMHRRTAEAEIERAKLELRQAQDRHEQLKAARVAEHKQRLMALEKASSTANLALHRFDQEAEELRHEMAERHSVAVRQISSRIEAVSKNLALSRQAEIKAHSNRLAQNEADQKAALQSKGLDTLIMQVDAEITRLTNLIQQIEAEASKLREWLAFEKDYPVSVVALQQRIDALSFQQKAMEDQIEEAVEKHNLEIANLTSLIKQGRSRHEKLHKETERLKDILLRRLSGYESDPEGAGVCNDPEVLIVEINTALDQSRTAQEELGQLYGEIRRAFLFYPDGTVNAAWQTEARRHATEEYSTMRAFLSEWASFRQENSQEGYLSLLAQMKSAIESFANNRNQFHRDVRLFSDRLNRSLSQIHISDSIKNLRLDIRSDSRDDSYLPKILNRISEMSVTRESLVNDPSIRKDFTAQVRMLHEKLSQSNTLDMKPAQMISISGQVTENGATRRFDRSANLSSISSSGLSLMIQSTVLMGFINQIRGEAPVDLVWGLDELGTIDQKNTELLIKALNNWNIYLLTAQPNSLASKVAFDCFQWDLKPTPKGNIEASRVSA